MPISNLIIRGGADFSGIQKEMSKTQQTLNNFQANINNTMKKIGSILGTLAVGKVIKDSTEMAMGVESATDNIKRNMGENSVAFQKWINSQSQSLGIATSEAYKYGSTFSNLLSSFTKGTTETANKTEELMKATAIIASKTGRSYDDTANRIRSGMLGSTEAIEDLGVYTNISMIESTVAFKKFAGSKSWAQLDFQTQQQIRLASILEQTYARYGDALADTTQTRHAQFIASLKNIQLSLGNVFLPIYNAVLPALTAMANGIANVLNVVAQFSQALFGKANAIQDQTNSTIQQSQAVNSLGDAYKKTGKEAKKAETLAGFDEINSLNDNKSDGDSGLGDSGINGGGVAAPMGLNFNTNAPEVSGKITEMATKIRETIGQISDFMNKHKDIIISALAGIAAGFLAFEIGSFIIGLGGIKGAFESLYLVMLYAADFIKGALASAFTFLTSPLGIVVVAIAAAVAAFVYFYRTNESFRGFVDGILNKISEAATWLWKNALVPLGEFLGSVFKAAWQGIINIATIVWNNVFVPFGNFLLWFNSNVIVPLANIIKDLLVIAFSVLIDIAKSLWKNVLVPLGDFIGTIFKGVIEVITAVVGALWKNILVPLGEFLGAVFKPAWQGIVNILTFLWDNVLKPLTIFLAGEFYNVFDSIFKNIGKIIGDLKTIFQGIIDFIVGVFTGDWGRAWEGVKEVFKGIFDTFVDIVRTPLNVIIDAINYVIGGLNKINIKTPDWLPGDLAGKSFGVHISEIPKLAQGGYVGANNPMLAMIGDNRMEGEIVAPESKIYEQTFKAITDALGRNNDSPIELTMQVGSTTLGKVVIDSINKVNKLAGRNLIEV